MIEWRLDSDRPAGAFLLRHLSRCPACREHFRAHEALADCLRRQAADVAPCPGLSERVLSALPGAPKPLPGSVRVFPMLIKLAAAACIVVAVLVLALHRPAAPDNPKKPVAGTRALQMHELVSRLSPQGAAERSSEVVELLAQAAIKSQIDGLAQDAKAAGEALLASITVDFAGRGRALPTSNRTKEN